MIRVLACLLLLPAAALAGGSNYRVAPGGRDIAGRVSEWPVPTPQFARDAAPGPDVDAEGRYWYMDMGSHNGRLGVIE